MKNLIYLMFIVLFIGLVSCNNTNTSNQNQNQEEKEYELKNINEINKVLNSFIKIYSFKDAKLIKSDEAFSPPKEVTYKYESIN